MKVFTALIFALAIALSESKSNVTKKGSSLNVPNESSTVKSEMQPNPRPIVESDVFFISDVSENEEMSSRAKGRNRTRHRIKNNKRKQSAVREAVQVAAIQGLAAMIDLYEKKEPEMLKRGAFVYCLNNQSNFLIIIFFRRLSPGQSPRFSIIRIQRSNLQHIRERS